MIKRIFGNGFHIPAISLTLLLITMLAQPSDTAAAKQALETSGKYAINLVSSLKPVDPKQLPDLKVLREYLLYTTRHKERGKNWYRLRIGFFTDAKSASRVMKTVRKEYPEAWVTKVTDKERAASKRLSLKVGPTKTVKQKRPSKIKVAAKKSVAAKIIPSEPKKENGSVSDKNLISIMESGETAMTNGKFRLAAQLYTKVLQYKEHKFSKEARELLGLAYERSNRLAHAKAEYRSYLILYPEGEGTKRVRQRLAGLETATAQPQKKLRKKKVTKESTRVYGSFSQFFNRDESYTDLGGKVVTRSTLSNDFDINIRKRTGKYELNSVFIAGYELDLFHMSESTTSISRLYVDLLDRRLHVSGRLGRQSRSTGGVLGRFDGALISYQYFPRIKINAVAGYPLDTSELKGIDTDKYFYGVSVDLGTFAQKWDFNAFFIDQINSGITDRRAVGGEMRYYQQGRSMFSLIDYDISYGELNTLLLVGNWTLPSKTTINTSFDYRKSPTLSTTNGLLGQTAAGSVSELLDIWGEDEVRNLADDRTATNRSFMIGATRPLSKKFQVNGDFTVSETTGTPASGGVDAVPGTGHEHFFAVQLIGSGLIKPADTAIAGLRFSNTSTANTLSLNLNTRYPVNRKIRINPRLRFDLSKVRSDGARQVKVRPSLRTDWYWKRDFKFEFEGGMEWGHERVSNQTNNSIDYFIRVGYRAEF